jgi:hypothetical protein
MQLKKEARKQGRLWALEAARVAVLGSVAATAAAAQVVAVLDALIFALTIPADRPCHFQPPQLVQRSFVQRPFV